MKKASIKEIANIMRKLDFCMMITKDGRNTFHARPMSNNRKVDYDGDSWFYSYEDSGKVRQIKENPMVSLIFQAEPMLFVDCYGKASITKNEDLIREKWVDGLEAWFPEGPETKGICLIKVTADRVQYWAKDGEGEYRNDKH